MKPSMKKWLKRIGIAFAILLALVVMLAWWLLATESGARFALERAKSTLAGKLLIARAGGALVSPLELHDVEYKDPASGLYVKVKTLKIEYGFLGLLRKTLGVQNLDIDGVEVTLTTVAPTPKPPQAATPSLQSLLAPPLDILIERLHVGKVTVTQDGKPVFASDSLDAAATWTSAALTVKQLALRAPDGKVDLVGAITSYKGVVGSGKLDIDWKIPNGSGPDGATPPKRAVGIVNLENDSKQAHFVLALTQPLAVNAKGTLNADDAKHPWSIDLDVPSFDPKVLSQSDALKSIAVKLTGSGDKNGGTVSGNIDVNAHRVLFDPLKFATDGKILTLDPLRLRSPEAAGSLTAQAKVQLDTKPVGGELHLVWEGVELPADLVGQALSTHGDITAGGNADKFSAHGALAIGPHAPKQVAQVADLAFRLDGTPEKISLAQLELKQPKGGLSASGDIVLKPKVGWNLQAKANQLNPGAFAKDWPGAINFTLSTSGNVEKAGPSGRLKLDNLSGTLRERALGGNADLAFAPPLAVDGKLNLSSGKSSVALVGKGGAEKGAQTDVKIELSIDSLGDWVPKTGGSLRGNIAASGAWPKLDASGHLDGAKIVTGDTHLETLALSFDAHDLTAPSGTLHLDAKTLAAGGYVFDTVRLDAKGDQGAHHVELDMRGKPLALNLALDGALSSKPNQASDWHATLTALALDVTGQPSWKLAHPAALAYAGGAFSLDELCLRAGTPALCASANQDANNATQAKFSLEHLPLTMIAKLASPDAPLKLEGEINGNGNVVLASNGALSGQATIKSDSGSVTYPDSASQALLAYKNFHIDAVLSPQQNTLTIASDLNDGGRIDGHIVTGAPDGGAMPLSGNLAANINNLSFMDLLTPQLSGTKGKVEAKFALSGTTAKPGIDGQLALVGFATEVPAAGLKLHDGNIAVRSRDGETFDIDGSIGSADGKLALKGSAGIAANAPITLTLQGEDFVAADIPGARVHVSPDLKIDRDAKRLRVTGTLQIPSMYVDLSKLPGGGGGLATPSPDVVVIDEKAPPAVATLPIEVEITLKLGAGEKLAMDLRQGTEVHLIGYGLNSNLGGQLTVQQAPGQAPIGRGQIQLNGTFKAYGQDLTIEQGRLLFAGTPVENPGLDIRATRAFPDQNITVGLQVRGTAIRPSLTVFSNPAMEQSDALSYLVVGKPLSQLKGGDGNAVAGAASALGNAGGDLLAKSIGAKMGLDDVGVADNSSVGGAALSVGKYLSPRLYIGYGVGLFIPGQVVTLRYKLTRLFDFEMQNGTLSSRAGVNYRIEK
jgi:translocation and assembly module TamB